MILYSQTTMASDFLTRLNSAPILCDGAMGTLLYAKGVFINRSYDELNLSQPDLVRAVHQDYLQSGAEVIETNTFGAKASGLADTASRTRFDEINLAGARLAREAAKSFDVWVAGSVGPLGIRIEPSEKRLSRKRERHFGSRLRRWSKVAWIC